MKKFKIDLPFLLSILFLVMLFGHNLNPDTPGNKRRRQEQEEKERLIRICKELQKKDGSKEKPEPVDSDYLIKNENSETLLTAWSAVRQQTWVNFNSDSSPKMHQKKEKLKKKVRLGHRVTVTRYNPVRAQCDDDPLTTADNSKINLHKLRKGNLRWVAISRDLRNKFKYGDIIYIDSSDANIRGEYIVHDTMHPRFSNRIDILTAKEADHGQGIWYDVKIVKKA